MDAALQEALLFVSKTTKQYIFKGKCTSKCVFPFFLLQVIDDNFRILKKTSAHNNSIHTQSCSQLLQKIEELTLYTIDQEEQLKEQAEKLQKMQELENRLNKLEALLNK